MTIKNFLPIRAVAFIIAIASIGFLSSCSDDDDNDDNVPVQTKTFEYQFHDGQTVPSAPYSGIHASNLSATLKLDEMANGNTNITVSIQNTQDGQTYHTHAHDAADASSTPNGTPFNESPNADIFAQALEGNGGTATMTQETSMAFDELTENYSGFFVIHDPLQAVNTVDISTYVVVGSFAREQAVVNFTSSTFDYDFNTGQLVPDFAYTGTHPSNLSARIIVDELADNQSRVTVQLNNTLAGETYNSHAHDVANPTETPNGTPYNETPNADVFAAPIMGNGETAGAARISPKSFDEIVNNYEGFFVVHDPLQDLSTVDPTTYVILGSFAR